MVRSVSNTTLYEPDLQGLYSYMTNWLKVCLYNFSMKSLSNFRHIMYNNRGSLLISIFWRWMYSYLLHEWGVLYWTFWRAVLQVRLMSAFYTDITVRSHRFFNEFPSFFCNYYLSLFISEFMTQLTSHMNPFQQNSGSRQHTSPMLPICTAGKIDICFFYMLG